MVPGKVYLVGAGPGDAELITVKGLRCLEKADVIIYDRLIDNTLLDAAPGAEKIYVGKSPDYHAREQGEINKLLLDKAKQGNVVVRLKGGDPFVLGRGGEEVAVLAKEKIPFEVVPGVSSAVAVPAYAGIPVTHRNVSSSFTVYTGHRAINKADSSQEEWSAGEGTLVFLMGITNLRNIVATLIKNGKKPSTPVAVICNGTGLSQITVEGRLDTIADKVKQAKLKAPGVVVIGEVVKLRQRLRWFDTRPLFGKRVLVTRAKRQSSQLLDRLREYGAITVEMPTIEIRPLDSTEELDGAIGRLDDYNWILFTSVNGVNAFFTRVQALGSKVQQLKTVQIGAIGPATAGALGERGIIPDYIPKTYTSRGLLTGLKKENMAGARVLLPRADIADRELASGLVKMGAVVDEVVAYKTEPEYEVSDESREALLSGKIDITIFTSASTVVNLFKILNERKKVATVLNSMIIACIGPKTAAKAKEFDIKVDIVAHEHTTSGLLQAIVKYVQGRVE